MNLRQLLGKVFVCSVLTIASTNIFAGAVNFDNQHLGDSGSCPNPNVSNPINIASGNKFHKEDVYTDTGNFPLHFSWFYNSRAKGRDGVYRGIWSHTYGEYGIATMDTSGKVTDLELVRADGSYQLITPQVPNIDPNSYATNREFPDTPGVYTYEFGYRSLVNGTYNLPGSRSKENFIVELSCINNPDPSIGGTICAYSDLKGLKVKRFPSGIVEEYSFEQSSKDSSKYIAKIISLEAPTGEKHTIDRSINNEVTVTHSNGRSLTLRYALGEASTHIPEFDNQYPTSLTVGSLSWDFIAQNSLSGDHPHYLRYIYSENGGELKQLARFDYFSVYDTSEHEPGYDWGTQLYEYFKSGFHVAGWRYDSKGRAILSYHLGHEFTDTNSLNPTQDMVLADRISNLDDHDLRTYTNRYGKSTTYGYQKVGDEVKLINISGNATVNCGASNSSYTYFETGLNKGQLKQVVDAKGFIKEFTYTPIGRKESVTYAKDTQEEYSVIYGWGEKGTEEYKTNQELGLVQSITTPGLKTSIGYNSRNRLQLINRIDTSNTRDKDKIRSTNLIYEFYPGTDVLKKMVIRGPLAVNGTNPNDKTEVIYDTLEHVSEIRRYLDTNKFISTSLANYNDWGLPEQIIDENDVTTTIQYQALSNGAKIRSIQVGNANPITFEYTTELEGIYSASPWEMPTRIIYSDGSWVRIHYSANNYQDIDFIENNLGERKEYSYDRENIGLPDDKITVTQTIKRTINNQEIDVFVSSQALDALGRLYQSNTSATSSEFNYDLNSNISKIKQIGEHLNNNGNLSLDTTINNNGSNLASDVSSPDSGTTIFAYDDNKLSKITDAEQRETSFIKNGFGEIIQKISPDSGTTDYYYDPKGNLEREVRDVGGANEQEIIYEYDLLNRITSVTYTGSLEGVTYTYDDNPNSNIMTNAYGVGKLTKSENSEAISEFYYSESGALTKTRVLYKDLNKTYTTDYKINEKTLILEEMTYPSGLILVYGRNELGQVTSIGYKYNATESETSFITNITYWPMGPIETISFANGTTQTFTLDDSYRPSKIEVSNNIMSLDYKNYDQFGNLTQRDWSTKNNPLETQNYTYDMAHRLDTTNTEDFDYNQIGDRVGLTNNSGSFTYNYSQDGSGLSRISIPETGAYKDFDELGNLVADSKGLAYNYNFENRLASVTSAGIEVANYGYDIFGQRIRKRNANGNTYFVYGQKGELLAETDGTDWQNYIFIDGRLVGRIDNTPGWTGVYSTGSAGPIIYTGGNDVVVDSDVIGSGDYFAYQTVSGNTSLTAEINSLEGTTTGAEAGVEIRANSSATANFARISLYSTRQIILLYGDIITPITLPQEDVLKLTYQDATGVHELEYAVDGNTYFKVERTDAGVVLYTSADGVNWTQRGETLNLGLPDNALIGFRANSIVENVSFNNVSLNGATVTQRTPYSIYTDHLATPIVIANQSKTVVWEADYSAFGNVTLITNSIENNIRFPGQYFDVETGLHYNYFRDYDPEIGRYIQSDPIGLAGGINTYGYVKGNPVNYVDRNGLYASQLGFYVHQRAIYLNIGSELSPAHRRILNDAQVYADGAKFQDSYYAYRHAMRNSYQTARQACFEAQRFVKRQFNNAWKEKRQGNEELALFQFSVGLHTLQDSISPSHRRFQEWTGDENIFELIGHAIPELFDVGFHTQLDEMTQNAWKWYQAGSMPKDVFNCGCESE